MEYIFPGLLAASAIFLAVRENKTEKELREASKILEKSGGQPLKPDYARLGRRSTGILLMLISAASIAVLIYRMKSGNLGPQDLYLLAAAAGIIILIVLIGVWDIISETGKLKRKAAELCREDYSALMAEIEKAKSRESENESRKSRPLEHKAKKRYKKSKEKPSV